MSLVLPGQLVATDVGDRWLRRTAWEGVGIESHERLTCHRVRRYWSEPESPTSKTLFSTVTRFQVNVHMLFNAHVQKYSWWKAGANWSSEVLL